MFHKKYYINGKDTDMEDRIREILEYYSAREDRSQQDVVVQMLRDIQEISGSITPKIRERAAKAAGVKEGVVQLLVKRYPSLKEVGYVHEIVACSGPRCGAKQGAQLLQILKEELKIGENGISEDGRLFLRTQRCLKQCRTSPNILVDGVLHSHMDEKKVRELVKTI